MKKIILLAFGLFFIHLFYIGCCGGCGGFVNSYRKVKGLFAQEYAKSQSVTGDTVIVQDSLFAIVNLQSEYIAFQKPKIPAFISTASATSCECLPTTDLGLKYNIDSFVIKSDKPFAGFAVGENIQSIYRAKLQLYDNNFTNAGRYDLTLRTAIDSINANKEKMFSLTIYCNVQAGVEKYHRFTYNIYSTGQGYPYSSSKTVKFP